MTKYTFEINERVTERETGKVGRVKYRSETGSSTGGVNVRIYTVLFTDGTTKVIEESKLMAAGPGPPGPQ
jgi:hypothetical protein